MPMKPKVPCSYPRCPELIPSGATYCEKHCKQMGFSYSGKRSSSAQRGYGHRWRKVRARYLNKHPLCVRCMTNGRYTMATVVDHIQPHRGDPVLMWDEDNFQALCKPCHDWKTRNEDVNPEYHY